MTPFVKKHRANLLVALILMIASIFFACELIRQRVEELERERRFPLYTAKHHCVRTGFAGKDAESVYQCDNGLWKYHELLQLAGEESP